MIILNKTIYRLKKFIHTNDTIHIFMDNFSDDQTSLEIKKIKAVKKYLNNLDKKKFTVIFRRERFGMKKNWILAYDYMFKKYKKAIVACKNVKSQYGHLNIKGKKILSFVEKPLLKDPINIGYYFFSKEIFNKFYKKNYELEDKFMKSLIKNNKIIAYNHNGFFFNIDRKIDLDNIKKNYRKLIFTL